MKNVYIVAIDASENEEKLYQIVRENFDRSRVFNIFPGQLFKRSEAVEKCKENNLCIVSG